MADLDGMRILQVSTADIAGGAEKVAWQLFQGYRRVGNNSWLAVGLKRSADQDALLLQSGKSGSIWPRLCLRAAEVLRSLVGKVKLQQFMEASADPRNGLSQILGHEAFNFPATWHLLDLPPERPDIVHCHNLHGQNIPGGGYFDLRSLPWLSQQVPLVLTLHDAWLLSGHCAHSFDCQRWRIGCGRCPDLTIPPAIWRDKTAYNWRQKQQVFATSHFYVATPSQWLMKKVEESILTPAIREAMVIPNGIDLSVFQPADRKEIRALLGIPQEHKVLLFTANSIRRNVWKDYETLRAAIGQVGRQLHGDRVLFVALGEGAQSERVGPVEIRFVPYEEDSTAVARYYQASDIYVHAAKADTFPISVLEALACGVPVVATAVGGIPEQIKGLQMEGHDLRNTNSNRFRLDEATGILVSPGDEEGLARGIKKLLRNAALRDGLGQNAAQDASKRFDLNTQLDVYLRWYSLILERSERASGL
jgi:glycosyltransferase involved in cell wall biosynthesis